MAQIEIDGKKIEAEPGTMVIEAADKVGIWIPRFCYHKKLSIAANCRMCLVEVEKSGKPLPACATPITDGMKVYTRSQKALEAQRSVMEFLLINHPLDCPICDQGGECELQDISMGYGSDVSQYTEGKRVVIDENLGSLIATDMTRCIQCTRCVRYGSEVVGQRELGATGRGEHMEISTFVEKTMDSEVSGNIIDICPVGALTSKPFRFKGRAWEMRQSPSISPHDCLGTNIFVHSRQEDGRVQVMRVVPRENEEINEVWLSDRDRFSYEGLYQERLESPMLRRDGEWKQVSWEECLSFVAEKLAEVSLAKESDVRDASQDLAALASPNLTCEEFYLLQKLLRGLGSNQIDHRLRTLDFSHQEKFPLYPNSGISFADLENQSCVLLIGSDLRNEVPLLNLKLRKMQLAGKKIFDINPIKFEFNFNFKDRLIVEGGDLLVSLAAVTKAILGNLPNSISSHSSNAANEMFEEIKPTNSEVQFAKELCDGGDKISIFLGALALSHPKASEIIAVANLLCSLTGATLGLLTDGANAAGAWIAGCVPHRLPGGKSIEGFESGKEMDKKSSDKSFAAQNYESFKNLKAMILAGVEPDLDCGLGERAMEALSNIPFVAAITAYDCESLRSVATVLLPMSAFTETSGTFVNLEGRWQQFKANVQPFAASRPAWKIFRVLGNLLGLQGFEFDSSEEVLAELFEKQSRISGEKGFPVFKEWEAKKIAVDSSLSLNEFTRIAAVPLYSVDSLVRRSKPLQETNQAKIAAHINPETALQFKLNTDDSAKFYSKDSKVSRDNNGSTAGSVILKVKVDEKIPKGVVLIPTGVKETLSLGSPYEKIEIEAV